MGLEAVLVAFAGTGLDATFATGLVVFAGALLAGAVARAGDFWEIFCALAGAFAVGFAEAFDLGATF